MAPERNPLGLCNKCADTNDSAPLRSSPASASVEAKLPEDAARFPEKKNEIRSKSEGTQDLDPDSSNLANSTLYSTREAALAVAPAAGVTIRRSGQQDMSAKAVIEDMKKNTGYIGKTEINADQVGKDLNASPELARKYGTHDGSRFGATSGHKDNMPSRAEILKHDRGTGHANHGNTSGAYRQNNEHISHNPKDQQQQRARTAVGWLRTLAGRAKL